MGRRLTTEEWIAKAKKVHGNTYDYSKVVYTKSGDNVEIVCRRHGKFFIRANNHVSRAQGCTKCLKEKPSKLRSSKEAFVLKAGKVHGDLYDYSKVVYITNHDKVEIICPIHGSFWQTPLNHTFGKGKGCKQCAKNPHVDTKSFKDKATKLHKGFYSYDKVEYKNSRTKIIITCPIHGDFEQTPNKHLNGCGCPSCAVTGFKDYLPAVLYYLRVEFGPYTAYKIGITNRTVARRYRGEDLSRITVIKEWEFINGKDARIKEQEILNNFKVYLWKGPQLLNSAKISELFDRDILELDSKGTHE